MISRLRWVSLVATFLSLVGRGFAQGWFFTYDGTVDFACARTADGNNAFFRTKPAGPNNYWQIVDNGLGGRALRHVENGDNNRWYGHGSRPEYYRGPCDAFAMENFVPGRQAFTLAFRLKVDSYPDTSTSTRIFNCEYQTTLPNPYSTSYPTYTFRVEFCVRKSGTNLVLQDFRLNDVLGVLKQGSQPSTWHTVWATITVPPGLNQADSIYRLWFDGVEVNWSDRDKGGWSDVEFGCNAAYADISWDYLCYSFDAALPGQIPLPGETPPAATNHISGLKLYPDATPCELTNKRVTGIFVAPVLGMTNYFIAEPDGSDGIRVRHDTGLPPQTPGGSPVALQIGDTVTVRGGLMSPACEKQISAHEIIRTATGSGVLPFMPPVLDHATIGRAYHRALWDNLAPQCLATVVTGTLTSVAGNWLTDRTKTWGANQWKNRTVYLPAVRTRGDRYYHVHTNDPQTLTVTHRTIEFNVPNLPADDVQSGDPYEFVGGLATGPRLDGRRIGTRGYVTAVNAVQGYFDLHDGTAGGEVRTLQDIWDRIHYADAWTPPAGLRVRWSGPMPTVGDRLSVRGCLGAERFKQQAATTINGSTRDEVKVDKVYPMVMADGSVPWTDPAFTAAAMTATGFVARAALIAGEPYRIARTTNLQDWTELTNFVAMTEDFWFWDTAASSRVRGFYRVVSP